MSLKSQHSVREVAYKLQNVKTNIIQIESSGQNGRGGK